MSENQEHKTWVMYKKAVKEIKFTSCPWNNCTWSSGTPRHQLGYGVNELGTFKIMSNAYGAHSNYPHLYGAFTYYDKRYIQASLSQSRGVGNVTVTMELPEGVLINPKVMFLGGMGYNGYGAQRTYTVKGFNPATGLWETLWTVTKARYNKETINLLSITVNTNNFYSKFSWYGTYIDGEETYGLWTKLRVDSGTIRIK